MESREEFEYWRAHHRLLSCISQFTDPFVYIYNWGRKKNTKNKERRGKKKREILFSIPSCNLPKKIPLFFLSFGLRVLTPVLLSDHYLHNDRRNYREVIVFSFVLFFFFPCDYSCQLSWLCRIYGGIWWSMQWEYVFFNTSNSLNYKERRFNFVIIDLQIKAIFYRIKLNLKKKKKLWCLKKK